MISFCLLLVKRLRDFGEARSRICWLAHIVDRNEVREIVYGVVLINPVVVYRSLQERPVKFKSAYFRSTAILNFLSNDLLDRREGLCYSRCHRCFCAAFLPLSWMCRDEMPEDSTAERSWARQRTKRGDERMRRTTKEASEPTADDSSCWVFQAASCSWTGLADPGAGQPKVNPRGTQ